MSNFLRRPWIETSIQQKLERSIKGFETFGTDCLQIHLGNGKPVQFLRFLSTSVAEVSDSKTIIRAKIHSRNPAEPICGSIITVKRCKLILNSTSRSYPLLLEIEDFKVLGSENSSWFGHPSDILKSSTIAQTLSHVRALMLDSNPHDRPLSQFTPPRHVETSVLQGVATQDDPRTQQDFATQDLGLLSKDPRQPASQVEREQSGNDDLLKALLGAPKPQQLRGANVEENVTPPENATKSVETSRKLSQVSQKEALLRTSKVQILANIRQNHSQLSHGSGLEHSPKATSINKVAVGDEAESEKGNSQEAVAQNHIFKRTITASPPAFDEPHNPFAGIAKMPRNLVKISREQQELLDRKESWHCPSAGSQTAYATIPVKVREDLKSFMNKPPGETQNGIASDHITVSDDTDDSSESEDESHRSVHSAADNQFEQTRANSQDAGGTQFATNEEGEESDAENLSDEESASCSMASLQTKSENYGGSKHRAMTNEEDDPDGVSEPSPAANRHRTFPTSRVTAPLISQQRASENGQGKSNLEAAANRTSASLTKVELQSATRRAPPPDFYPSSAPDQDLELDELHAEGDEVEHDEGEEVQIPQSSQVLPSTAPTKPRLIQVERSPFNDTNLIVQADKKTFLISRPSSAKNIEDLYESPSSDPVVVATYENKSQETETTESALDNEQHTLGSREKDDSMTGFTQGILPQEIRVIDNGDSSESDEDIRSPPSLTYNADKPSPLLNTSVQPLSRKSKPCVALTPILDSISSRLVTPEVMCALAQPTIPGKENDAIPSPSVPASLYRKPTEMVTNLSREQTPLMPSPPKRLAAEKAIQQEAFTRRNTKKMARAARHKFNEDCLPVERNLPPTNLCPLIPRTPPVEARPIITQDTRHSTSPRRDLPLSQENRPSQSQRTPPVQAMPQDARPLGVDQSNKTTSDQQRITPERASYSNSNRSRHTSESPDGSQGDLTVLDAHQQFLAAYPGYAGSRNNFTWALVYIEWLRKANQVLPGFLFDDFIRVISYEYITYVHDCQRKDLQPLTGWHFYDEKVDEPKFTKSVIQRKNLSDALLTLDQRHVEKIRAQFSATSEPDDSRVRGSETPSTIQPVRQPSTADASSSKRLGDTAPSGMNEKSPASKVTLPSSPIILQNSPLHQRTSSAKAKTSAPTRSTPAKSTPTRLTRAQQTPKSPILGIDSDSKWINAIKSLKQLKEKRDIDESRIRAKTSDNGKSISEASVTKRKPEHSTEDISHPAKKPRVDRKSLGSTTSLRTPFLAIPQPASVSEQSETTSRVTGGLNNIKKGATFKDMLEGIQQSGGLKSRLSTPSSTAAKRFCTKTKQDAEVMVMEPKTQAWNYD